MADVADNHDKAHEVMTEDDAVKRGQALAEVNAAKDQERQDELDNQAEAGVKPAEGNVPENNKDNGEDTGPNRGDLSNTRPTSGTTGRGVKK